MDSGLKAVLIDAATQQVANEYTTRQIIGVLDDDAPATITSSHISWYVEILADSIRDPLCYEIRVTDIGDIVAMPLPDATPTLAFLYPDPLPWDSHQAR